MQRIPHLHLVNRADAEVVHPTVEISSTGKVARRTVTWFGITAESVEFQDPGSVKCRFQAPIHLLVAYEQGERRGGETAIDGLPQSTLRSFASKLTFVPAGLEYRERHEPSANTRLTYFYVDPSRLTVHSEPTFAGNLAPRLFFDDLTIWQTAAKLKTALHGASANDQLYLKALALVLMYDLARFNREQAAPAPKSLGGLAGWQQRTVAAYIEKHLAERISLGTLAELVKLSRHHFCRAFKKSFGTPPHRYQINHRIARAQALLAKPFVSVTEVALELGFSNSSTFASAFRKSTGLTATSYSRSHMKLDINSLE